MRPSLAWCALALAGLLAVPLAQAQPAPGGPVPVDVTILVLNFGNHDAKQGTYVLDFYLQLAWDVEAAPANFSAEGFEFTNGRASSQTLLDDTTEGGRRTLYYRVQANLYSTPRYDKYPFDTQYVEVAIEDTTHPDTELVYVPDHANSGLDQGFEPAGWEVGGTAFTTLKHHFASEQATYDQARFSIALERSVLSGVLKVLLPPLAFVAIAFVAFFLRGADKIATRFSLAANMAISGIMFHAAQAASLPSLSRIIFLDRYMLAVHVVTFGSVAVTALITLAELKWKDPARAARINVRGAVLVGAAAVAVFLLLQLV